LNKIGKQFFGQDEPRSLEELVKNHYVGVEDNDRNIGEIFNALEKNKQLADTAMVWSSDHGFFLGEHRFYDKRLMYEPSIRIPMVVRYPRRIKAGSKSTEMVLNVDVMPSILDLAGVKPAADLQGKSFIPLLEGRQIAWRKDWLYEYYDYPGSLEVRPSRGVRNVRYKYIHYFLDPQEYEFYDLKNDPDEMYNLYSDPRYKDLIARHAARLEELRAETKDTYVYRPTVKRKEG
ncbi:MAG: sulfatase/phosphatase domain-containing protein, partial [Bryocella sp.]